MRTAYSIRVEGDAAGNECRVDPLHAADPLILALDVGTSSARALVYDGRGRAVERWEIHRPYRAQITTDGGAVVDPVALFDLVAACIDDILGVAGTHASRIVAVACDTFWHSLMGVDERGEPRTPVYTWADIRSGEAARALRRELNDKQVHARTGSVLHSIYLPAKLRWLRQTDPDTVRSVSYWMSFGEYLYLRLFGDRRISISMASGTGLFNQHSCEWDQELLQAIAIRPEQLSSLAEFSDAMFGLRAPFSERWRALTDLSWNLPVGDGGCNNIGSGGICPKWAVAMIGTSGALRVVRETGQFEIPRGLWTYRVDRRRIVQGGALSDGGNVFAWLSRTLQLDAAEELEQELLGAQPDAHGLTMLPFLAGERSPDWNLDARAAIVGMRLDTTALDIARAALEAVAYRFAIIYDLLKRAIARPEVIIGSGAGLVHSRAWMQIMTDVLGEPMVTSAVPEASSRGAALLVLEAMGILSDLSAAPAPLGPNYEPNTENTRLYRAAMARQQGLYERLFGAGGAS